MQYRNVYLESLGYALPDEVLSSEEIERRLEPLYTRLKLPPGRLELMSGIRERRMWPKGLLPSEPSVVSGERAIAAAGIDRREIGALVHGSVCRDYLEPATASGVHHRLELPQECQVFDLSNACLGLLNGMLLVANMIELGQIRAGLVVGTESSRSLLETTIATLNRDTALTRQQLKSAVASLTIGSGSCALLLVDGRLARNGTRLVAAACRAHTEHYTLCQGTRDGGAGDEMLMRTDSERLMREGTAAGVATFEQFLSESGWSRADVTKTCCHQVGSAHRKMMLESLGLPLEPDFTTFEWLGNTGSVALPITLARAAEAQFLTRGDRVGLLGIGSGINCVMVAADYQQVGVLGDGAAIPRPHIHLETAAAPR